MSDREELENLMAGMTSCCTLWESWQSVTVSAFVNFCVKKLLSSSVLSFKWRSEGARDFDFVYLTFFSAKRFYGKWWTARSHVLSVSMYILYSRDKPEEGKTDQSVLQSYTLRSAYTNCYVG